MGSILERTATLFARHLAVFLATAAIVIGIPIFVGAYAMLGVQSAQIQSMLHALTSGTLSPSWTLFTPSLRRLVYGELLVVLGLLLEPFALAAIAANVDAILSTGSVRLRYGIARAIVRLPQIVGVTILSILIDIGATIAFTLVVGGIVAGVVSTYQFATHSVFLISVLVTVGLFVLVAALGVLILAGMALLFALFSATLEGRGVLSSVSLGFERIFARQEWKRALLVWLVAIVSGLAVTWTGGALEAALNLIPGGTPFAAVLYTLAIVTTAAVTGVFYAVYYHDARTREAQAEEPSLTLPS